MELAPSSGVGAFSCKSADGEKVSDEERQNPAGREGKEALMG